MRRLWPIGGCRAKKKKSEIKVYKQSDTTDICFGMQYEILKD